MEVHWFLSWCSVVSNMSVILLIIACWLLAVGLTEQGQLFLAKHSHKSVHLEKSFSVTEVAFLDREIQNQILYSLGTLLR